ASMSRSKPLAYSYTLEQAIADKMLCDYEICIPVFDDDKKDTMPKLAELIAENVGVWNHILVYCNTVDKSKHFAEVLQKQGVRSEFFDGHTRLEDRLKIVR